MRKNEFFAFSLLFAFGVQINSVRAACDQPVDSKKVVLFIDFNAAEQELLAAERAACARGESIEVIPSRKIVLEIGRAYGNYLRAYESEAVHCDSSRSGYSESRCEQAIKRKNQTEDAYRAARSKYPRVNNNLGVVKAKIAELDQGNRKLSSIVMSGHHGGAYFYGDVFEGQLGTLEILGLSQAYPKVFSGLQSFMAWGCTSVTPYSVSQMKTALPELKVVAGYINSGPLSIRPKSSQYLEDILIKEGKLSSSKTASDLKAAINGVNSIQQTFAGVYVNACGSDYFYSIKATEHWNETLGDYQYGAKKSFGSLESQITCDEFNQWYSDKKYAFDNYFAGYKSIPPTTDVASDLRMIYLFFRNFQHCLGSVKLPENFSDKVGLLLFFKGVQANFSKVFSDQITAAERELEKMNSSAWTKKFAAWEESQNQADLKLLSQIEELEEKKKQKIAALPPFTDVEMSAQAMQKAGDKLKPEVLRALKSRNSNAPLTNKLKGSSLKRENAYLLAKEQNERALALRAQKIQEVSAEWDQKIAAIQEQRTLIADERAKEKKLQADFLKVLEKQGSHLVPSGKKLVDLNRKELIELTMRLDLVTEHPAIVTVSESEAEFKAVRQLKSKMQRYLIDLDPECMGFLDWHADLEGRVPQPLCQ